MLGLLLQAAWRTRVKFEAIFDSSFELVCLFALVGLVLSGLLLDLHGRLAPSSPAALLVQWEGQTAGTAVAPGGHSFEATPAR